jgi:MtN3 and saliva related transmembrane protein
MKEYSLYIGVVAAFLTTMSFVPQVVQTVKTKDTESISLGMYIMFVTGLTMWLVYGIYRGDKPLILANSISVPLSAIILSFKLKEVFGKK